MKPEIEFMDHEGIISDADAHAYFSVIERAFRVHLDREKIRKGLWKEYPAEDQANQIKIKIDRVIRSLERMRAADPAIMQVEESLRNNILEELDDIINYSVFTSRVLRGQI